MPIYDTTIIQSLKSKHQKSVELFQLKAGKCLPERPITTMTDENRLLCAKLLLEETLETINDGLGIEIFINPTNIDFAPEPVEMSSFDYNVTSKFNAVETIDGYCDVKYVSTYGLSLLGVPDTVFQGEVDNNNLMKFSHGGHRNDDGKWIKPDDHPSPQISKLLESMTQ